MVQFTEIKYIELWTDKSFADTWMCLMTLKIPWSGYTQKHNELIFLYLIAVASNLIILSELMV